METKHDPGGKVRLAMIDGMQGGASFSECERYRHVLERWWGAPYGAFALWIGMNPSTADATVDDPTVRQEIRHTKRMERMDGYVKVNVMDYRSTSPKGLLAKGVVPCSENNLPTILKLAKSAKIVVAAWGSLPEQFKVYPQALVSQLRCEDVKLVCLGTNKDGSPKHPLYVAQGTPLVPFTGRL